MAINDIFKGFYTNLYKAKTDFDEPICKQYLDKLELPQISQMDKESLEAPLSLEELHVSLKSLQKGKSPGLDGLPPELYLEIWDLVGILMLNSFNFAIEHGVFHRDQKISLISLLLKKGKDPLDCSSYRPISLIPCDLKKSMLKFCFSFGEGNFTVWSRRTNWFHQGAQCIWQYASTPSYSWLCGLPPNTLCGLFTWCRKSLWQARVELYVGSSAMFRLRWTLRFYD